MSLPSSDHFHVNDHVSVRIGADLKPYAMGTCSGFTTNQCVLYHFSSDRYEGVYFLAMLSTDELTSRWMVTYLFFGAFVLLLAELPENISLRFDRH
jgi:hypothetical protein